MTSTVPQSARVMQKGANIALHEVLEDPGTVAAVLEVGQPFGGDQIEVDVSVLVLGEDGKVRSDEDLIFYNQPVGLAGAVRLHEHAWVAQSGRRESPVALRLEDLADDVARVVLTASLDPSSGLTCRDAGALRLRLQPQVVGPAVATYDVATEGTERAVIFGEFYRRDGQWKFRAVGQGYAEGLEAIAREFGVQVEEPGAEDGIPAEAVADEAAPVGPSDETSRATPSSAQESAATPRPTPAKRVTVRRARRPPQLPVVTTETDPYQRARLFPIAGIGGGEEQERRATSALLAVMSMVRPFAHDLLRPFGSPAGSVKTYVEVPFTVDGVSYRPDGLIETRRGDRTWRCLVEVKTGSAVLQDAQVGAYVQIARDEDFDAVLTISNQISGVFDDHPVTIDGRKLKKVRLHHVSWDEIHARAVLWLAHPPSGDPTAVRVVEEFVRYLTYERSGLHGFDDMGPHWATVRGSVRSRTLTSGSQGAGDVCERFDQLIRHLGLHLTRLLGVEITSVPPRHTPDQASRRQQLADSGLLFGSLKVPGAVGTVVVRADLRAERLNVSVRLKAPAEGRARTRVNWLLRQLSEARDSTRVQVRVTGGSDPASRTLGVAREDPELLVPDKDLVIREFEVSHDVAMGTKRGVGRGSLITSALEVVETFYGEVVQHLRPPRNA